jgi:hypothetical protein
MSKESNDTAFNDSAPQVERTQALAEVMDNIRPTDSSVREVIEFINDDLENMAFQKALRKPNIVPFPANRGKHGMQSVEYDSMQVQVNGDYLDRPGSLSFEMMRSMVDQTPVLSSIVMTRQRQIDRFCAPQESGTGEGFAIRHRDRDHQLSDRENDSTLMLQEFFTNCGWETDPRRRRGLRRDSFSQFMKKICRDSLTMDSCAIETEFRNNRNKGIDGLYAVDGATIRLCSEEGYRGDDEIFALQVMNGAVRTAYTFDDLIYEPRNPRTDVTAAGYGMSEVELLVKTVTGYLNALTYNQRYFDSNAIPKGILQLSGDYSERDIAAFKRYWNSMVKGVNNSWSMPVMVSKDQESKATFDRIDADSNEMMFSRWMTFLTAVCCAVYGMDPAEINSDAFSAGSSPLSGNDTAQRLAASRDKGLRPMLSYFESLFTDYVVKSFSDKYVFRWTGLDEEDEEKRHEMRKMVLTVNEARAQEGYEPLDTPIGEAPLNQSLVGPWMQMQQQGGEEQPGQDFGEKGDEAQNGPQAPGDDQQDDDPQGQGGQPPAGKDPNQDTGAPSADDMKKSLADADRFGMPALKVWGSGSSDHTSTINRDS